MLTHMCDYYNLSMFESRSLKVQAEYNSFIVTISYSIKKQPRSCIKGYIRDDLDIDFKDEKFMGLFKTMPKCYINAYVYRLVEFKDMPLILKMAKMETTTSSFFFSTMTNIFNNK